MSIGYAIIVVLLVVVFGVYSQVTKSKNRPVVKSTHSGKSPKRVSDQRHLTRHETKILDQAKSLIGQNRILQASRLLESIGLERDAIAVLESNKHIHEAAQILMRMRRPNRAGIIYARNGYWTNAAECFISAGMFYEAGKASMASGDHGNAALLFEKASKFEEAAKIFSKCKLYIEAGRAYLKSGNIQAAVTSFVRKLTEDLSFDRSQFTSSDKDAMVKWLSAGNFNDDIVSIVQSYGQLHKPIIEFYKAGNYKKSVPLISKTKMEDINRIMLAINYEDISYVDLALAFAEAGMHDRSGMIFEAGGKFDKAGIAFEQFGDLERAYYCFERAGDIENSSRLKSKKSSARSQRSSAPSRFVLGEDSQLSELHKNLDLQPADSPVEDGNRSSLDFSFDVSAIEEMSAEPKHQEVRPQLSTYTAESPSDLSEFKLYIDEDDAPSPPEPSVASPGNETRGRNLSANAFLSTSLEKTEHFDSGASLSARFSKDESRYVMATHKNFFNCSIFVDLNRDECELIWHAGEVIEIDADFVLYDGISDLEGMYVVLEGTLSCTKKNRNDSKPSGSISASDSFGELSVLAEYQTPLQLTATSQCKVWYCSSSKFEQALFSNGNISTKIYKYYLTKLLTRLTHQSKAS